MLPATMTKGNFKLRISLSFLRICRSKKSSSYSSFTPVVAHNPNKPFEIIAYPKLPPPPPPPPPSTPDHPSSKCGFCRVLSFGSSGSECGSYEFIISTAHVTSACNLDSPPAFNMVENYDGFHEKLCNSPAPAEAEAETEGAYSSEDIHDLDQEESLVIWPVDHPLKTENKISTNPNREISIYAVMKKSTDPYEDFRKSMTEMIVEREIFEPEELQKLLMCFLSLNAEQHRVAIVEAFTQVWEEQFY